MSIKHLNRIWSQRRKGRGETENKNLPRGFVRLCGEPIIPGEQQGENKYRKTIGSDCCHSQQRETSRVSRRLEGIEPSDLWVDRSSGCSRGRGGRGQFHRECLEKGPILCSPLWEINACGRLRVGSRQPRRTARSLLSKVCRREGIESRKQSEAPRRTPGDPDFKERSKVQMRRCDKVRRRKRGDRRGVLRGKNRIQRKGEKRVWV